jgi:carbamoyl-phosphate synthase large subunit
VLPAARIFQEVGFRIVATGGTAAFLAEHGVNAEKVLKVHEGRPNVVDLIKNREIHLMVNTPSGKKTVHDSAILRQTALLYGLPYTTTAAGAWAIALSIRERGGNGLKVQSLQEYYGR